MLYQPTASFALRSPAFRRFCCTQLRIQASKQYAGRSFNFTTSAVMTSPTSAFFDLVKARHSFYDLEASSPIPDSRVQELISQTMLNVPSAFNSQTTRLVVLVKDEHRKFWTTTKATLAKDMDEETANKYLGRLDGFAAAYGTIVFLEDQSIIQKSQARNPAYADKFPEWSDHTSGMHQFVLWTTLEAEGLGCNLQHLQTPAVEKTAQETWNYPDTWAMKAQMVFGDRKNKSPPAPKDKLAIEDTVKVFGS